MAVPPASTAAIIREVLGVERALLPADPGGRRRPPRRFPLAVRRGQIVIPDGRRKRETADVDRRLPPMSEPAPAADSAPVPAADPSPACAAAAVPETASARAYGRAAAVFAVGVVVELAGFWLAGAWLHRQHDLGPTPLDASVLTWVRDNWYHGLSETHRNRVHDSMQQITAFGSRTQLAIIVTAAVLGTLLAGYYRTTVLIALASAGAGAIDGLAKRIVDRPRPGPDLVEHLDRWAGESHSFPSGHSMGSMAIYLTLAILLSRWAPNRRCAVFTIAAGCLLALLIGFSRVYLGVHYPSDVLAGWIGGAAWVGVTLLALRAAGPLGVWVHAEE
jgi:undecaprenyl-diphosphatase